MARENGTTGMYINMPQELSDRVSKMAKEEHRKKQDQVCYLLDKATAHLKEEKPAVKKGKSN